ncbi:uncharacterized protein LOC143199068 [Rhynchophorus ferrugineus]|uniref:Lysosome-associated membrane glycoprotein 2-like luminal domain-containing protein n=1 Tax=Rhynchophorus ferrugineus TaxID=354439 RepID=A0A834J290_RHYFE|nr:hypothetical protein GWI33_008291 [Rhynchophorus ferrugineus]
MARVWSSTRVSLDIFVVCVLFFSFTESISFNHKGTSRPRLKPTAEPIGGSLSTTVKPAKDNSGVAIYRFINRKTDTTCILLKTDGVVEVKFKLHGLDEQADSFIPENAVVTGNCAKEDTVKMTLGWGGYGLDLTFDKTPGGDHWYLSNVELTVSIDVPQFHGIKTRDNTIKLYSSKMLIPTPVGKSYLCNEVDIPLETDEADHPPKDVRGTLLLRLLQVQAFMYRSENFSTPFECKSQRSFRSETAPIAVGSTLAIAALATVTGYGVFRYFKVKNVQYNTME